MSFPTSSRQSHTDLAFTGSGQLLGDRTAYSAEAFYSNAAHGSSERAVPPSPHALSHPYSLDDARRIVRQPNRTDDELLEACKVLRLRGNYDDERIVTQIEQAVAQFQNMIEVRDA